MPFLLFVPYEVPLAGGGPLKEFDLLANSRFILLDDLKRIRAMLSVDQGYGYTELPFDLKHAFIEGTEVTQVRTMLSLLNASISVPEFDLLAQSAIIADNITYESLFAFAATFDGSGDYVTFPYTASNDYVTWTSSNQFTIEAWIKPVGGLSYTDGPKHPTLIGHRDPTSAGDYWSFGPIDTGEVCLYTYNGSPNLYQSGLSVNMNAWNHIALTKTGSGIEFHVNGVSTSRNGFNAPSYVNGLDLVVGSGNNVGYNGLISNLLIHSSSAFYEGPYDVPMYTADLTASTELLVFEGPTIVDSSFNQRVTTVVGDVSTTTSDTPF